eukprot:353893-Chlamydomonas_euryale.AAC.2
MGWDWRAGGGRKKSQAHAARQVGVPARGGCSESGPRMTHDCSSTTSDCSESATPTAKHSNDGLRARSKAALEALSKRRALVKSELEVLRGFEDLLAGWMPRETFRRCQPNTVPFQRVLLNVDIKGTCFMKANQTLPLPSAPPNSAPSLPHPAPHPTPPRAADARRVAARACSDVGC